MSTAELEGQLELFAAPAPPFTVYSCVWASDNRCGWCGSKGYHGGGAMRNPQDDQESWFYGYCKRCYDQHGQPKLYDPACVVNVDRTVKPPRFSG